MNIKQKSKKLYITIIITIISVCLVSLTAFAIQNSEKIQLYLGGELTGAEAVKFIDTLEHKSFKELIDYVDSSFASPENEKILYCYDVIKTKVSTTPSNEITDELLSSKISDDVKSNLLMICSAEEINIDYDSLLPLLESKNTSGSLKRILLDMLAGEGKKYVSVIEKYALEGDQTNIVNTLPNLYALNPDSALKICDNIFADLTTDFSAKHKAALITKANSLNKKDNSKEVTEFIEICDKILKTIPTDDKEEKEVSVIYALSLMQCKESFIYLMSLETDNAKFFRAYIVDENKVVIDKLLSEKPTSEVVSVLKTTADYYVPNEEYPKMLKTYLEKNAEYFNANASQKNSLLEVIK